MESAGVIIKKHLKLPMLKTLPLNIQTSPKNEKEMIGPKPETLNAILSFSRSLEVKKLKSKKVFIINN